MTVTEITDLIDRSLFADLGYLDGEGRPQIRRVFCTWHRGIGGHLISTNTSSSHVRDILERREACLYFCDSERFEGACLSGEAAVHFEREWKEMLWHPQDVMYYPGGVDDPDYCVIEFKAQSARFYRADGKGTLSSGEIAEHDRGMNYRDGYAAYRAGEARISDR